MNNTENYKDWYFEDYDGQSTEGFDYIGIIGREPERLINADEQVKEFIRCFGNRIVRIYKSESEGAIAWVN